MLPFGMFVRSMGEDTDDEHERTYAVEGFVNNRPSMDGWPIFQLQADQGFMRIEAAFARCYEFGPGTFMEDQFFTMASGPRGVWAFTAAPTEWHAGIHAAPGSPPQHMLSGSTAATVDGSLVGTSPGEKGNLLASPIYLEPGTDLTVQGADFAPRQAVQRLTFVQLWFRLLG
jgi:hypothetical protein